MIPRMTTFTLVISCLTTSNLPGFMDLTFQVYMQYCSLQHWTLLLAPVTSTTGYCFCFGSIPSFFLELFLHWSPAAYWAPTDLGSSSLSVLSFCLFILFMGSSKTRILKWFAILFSSAWKWKVKGKSLSRVWLLVTPWTIAYQAPPFMGFSSKSTGVGCHCLLRVLHYIPVIWSISKTL